MGFDPDLNCAGWSLVWWRPKEGLEVLDCGLISSKAYAHPYASGPVKASAMCKAVKAVGGHPCGREGYVVDIAVAEHMRTSTRMRGRPNDMIDLAAVSGCFLGTVQSEVSRLVTPQEWKGQRPKASDHMHTRSLFADWEYRSHTGVPRSTQSIPVPFLKALNRDRQPPSRIKELYDATGIALWALGLK